MALRLLRGRVATSQQLCRRPAPTCYHQFVQSDSTPRVQICENDEQKMGADIVRKALPYALKLISHNAGVNGSVVMDKVLSKSDDVNWGYNAATDVYEDLMKVGIIDPTKVRKFRGVCRAVLGSKVIRAHRSGSPVSTVF